LLKKIIKIITGWPISWGVISDSLSIGSKVGKFWKRFELKLLGWALFLEKIFWLNAEKQAKSLTLDEVMNGELKSW